VRRSRWGQIKGIRARTAIWKFITGLCREALAYARAHGRIANADRFDALAASQLCQRARPGGPRRSGRQRGARKDGPQRPADLPAVRRRRAPQTSTSYFPRPTNRPLRRFFRPKVGRIIMRRLATSGNFLRFHAQPSRKGPPSESSLKKINLLLPRLAAGGGRGLRRAANWSPFATGAAVAGGPRQRAFRSRWREPLRCVCVCPIKERSRGAVLRYFNKYREQPKALRPYTKELEHFVLWMVPRSG
jgi:hypothetical protein